MARSYYGTRPGRARNGVRRAPAHDNAQRSTGPRTEAGKGVRRRQAAKLLDNHKNKGLPYNPDEDGFVFAGEEIEAYIRRKEANRASYDCE